MGGLFCYDKRFKVDITLGNVCAVTTAAIKLYVQMMPTVL
jgi:hypothetical protein